MAKPKAPAPAARLSALDDDFRVFVAKPPSAADIDAVEATLGIALESGYRAFIASTGCAAAVPQDEVWPAPVAYEIRPRWQLERVIELYGFTEGQLPPELDVRARTVALRERGIEGWVATLGVPGTNLTLAHDAAGDYAWIDRDGNIERVTATFEHIVGVRLAQLQADKDRFVAEAAKAATKATKANAKNAKSIAAALVESPWDAEELFEGVASGTKDEVRTLLLGKLARKPDEELVAALATLPHPDTTAALLALLANANERDLRGAVADALGDCPGDDAHAALVALLDDPEPDLVGAVVEGLAKHDDPQLAAHIFARLDRWAAQGDDLMLHTVVTALREHAANDPRTVPALASLWDLAARHDGTLMASNAVYDALAALPVRDLTVATFERAVAHAHPYLQARGIGGLAALGRDVEAHLPTLVALLDHKVPSTQANAESAFAHLGARGRALLEDLATNGKGRTKAAARRALVALDAGEHYHAKCAV